MAKTNPTSTPAQGGGGTQQVLIDHVVSQEDLDNNKELVDAGVKIGDTVQLPKGEGFVEEPKQIEGTLQESETPEWVQTIIDSNQALIDSNNLVIASLDAFKENSADFVGQLVKEFAKPSEAGEKASEAKVQLIDEDEDYEVAPGKSFRDPLDFTKEYTEGDDVTHLGVIKLQSLLNANLIVESE